MNNKHYKIVAFVLLTVVVGTFTHCVQNSPIGGSSSSSSRAPSGTSNPVQTPEQVLNTAQVEVGLKNFEQIHYTFSALTGIPVTTTAVNNTYNSVEPTLPGENDVKVLQSTNQVSISRLAAEYCNQLITNGAFAVDRDRVFGAGIFTQLPANVDERAMIVELTDAFWGEGVVEAAELDAARIELENLFGIILTGEPNTAATTIKAGRAVCTAALSSAYVTIM